MTKATRNVLSHATKPVEIREIWTQRSTLQKMQLETCQMRKKSACIFMERRNHEHPGGDCRRLNSVGLILRTISTTIYSRELRAGRVEILEAAYFC